MKITDQQFDWMISHLQQLVAIPSLSNPHADGYDFAHLQKTSEYVISLLKEIGFDTRSVSIDGSAPYVLGKRHVHQDKPTVIIYAHYDVQPVDLTKWNSPPFEMTEKDGRYYGRGASDDKAGIVTALAAFKAYRDQGLELPINVTILFEGEEEYGSSHMPEFLKQEAKELKAHSLIVLDTMSRSTDTGTLVCSNRGFVNLSVEIQALDKPVHSGQGLLVPDPALDLFALLAPLKHPRNIPGILDGAITLSHEERVAIKESSPTLEEYAKSKGVVVGAELRGRQDLSVSERLAEEPMLSVHHVHSGQLNGGSSIQDRASCTINIRPLPGQDPDKVAQAVIRYLEQQPNEWKLHRSITQLGSGDFAWKGDLSRPFSKTYFEALKKVFPKTCAQTSGGTLPLLHEFEKAFPDIEVIGTGIEDPITNAHSHNESQDKALLRNATNALILFLKMAGEMKNERLS